MSDGVTTHRWKFFRFGGIDQVSIESAEDLKSLDKLDPKLWAAMTCPTHNIEFDARTLEYLDSDKDRRIKIPELLAAVKWVCQVLKNPEVLMKPCEAMPLDVINADIPEGKALLASARQILSNLGKEKEDRISLDDLADTQKIFVATTFNGDGIIPAEIAGDEATRRLIGEIMACMGCDLDRSGKPGISEPRLQAFVADASAYAAWLKIARDNAASIMFAGDDTVAMAGLYLQLKPRIDDFFIRCRLVAYDNRCAGASTSLEGEYVALLKKSLSTATPELKDLPLAMITGDGFLPMTERVNPAWAQEMLGFAEKVAKPITGETLRLNEAQWLKIKNQFTNYEDWMKSKAGATVEKLGGARVSEILASGLDKGILELIARDRAVEEEFNAIASVERLVRFYRYLYSLLNNFVVFKDFYAGKNKAVFQAGTLFMDSRSCELCVTVEDIAKHSAMAVSCNTFLVYCDCVRQGSSEKITIAAAFTDGDSDQLLPNRNGLFVDRKGNYWDATIVKIIDHPISIRQAFWSPYKRLGNMIHEQIEKFAASKDKSMTDSLSTSVSETGAKLEAQKPDVPTSAPFDAGKFAGIFAAIGLALAAIGSAVASVVSGFMALAWWQMPLAIIGILLLFSGPSMLLAAMRLRQRNLGAILDANGWAVNTRAQINMAFGKTLTHMAELPKGAMRSYDDPFAEKKSPWKLYLALLLILAIVLGLAVSPKLRGRVKNRISRAIGCEVKKPEPAGLPKAGPPPSPESSAAPAPAIAPAPTPAPAGN